MKLSRADEMQKQGHLGGREHLLKMCVCADVRLCVPVCAGAPVYACIHTGGGDKGSCCSSCPCDWALVTGQPGKQTIPTFHRTVFLLQDWEMGVFKIVPEWHFWGDSNGL